MTSDAGSETNDRTPQDESETPLTPHQEAGARGGEGLIFCGMCGALNPAGRYYCAACGTTLVDAFHATEGLRVYERPDSASRLIEIVPSGSELELVEDPDAPEDFARVRLQYGRLGYIRLKEVEAMAAAAPIGGPEAVAMRPGRPAPDINTNATGCISSTAALASIALVVAVGALLLALMWRADTYDQGTILLVFCFGLGPFAVLTIAFYLYARSREERLAEEDEEAA